MEKRQAGKAQAAERQHQKSLAEQGVTLMAGAATTYPFSETTQAAYVAMQCQTDSSGVQLLGRLVSLEENDEQLLLLANAANTSHGERKSTIGEIDLDLMRSTVQHVLSRAHSFVGVPAEVLHHIMADLYPEHMQSGLSTEEAADRERIIRREAERLILASHPRERSDPPQFRRGAVIFLPDEK